MKRPQTTYTMTPSPDKLFRDKLKDYRKPAPELAWGRIESNLSGKKKNKFLLLKIAAVLFVPVATYVLWPNTQSNTPPTNISFNSNSNPTQPDLSKSQTVPEEIKTIPIPPSTEKAKISSPKISSRKKQDAESAPVVQEIPVADNQSNVSSNSTAPNEINNAQEYPVETPIVQIP